MSVRQVVRLRVVEKKSRALSLQRLGSAFFICQIFSCQSRTAGQTSVSFRPGWSSPALTREEKKFCQSFFFQSYREGPTSLALPCSVRRAGCRFRFKEEVPSQSALVHKLMCSGFFICQNFASPFRLSAVPSQIVKKNTGCQQHPVFPGGHPSKY